MKTHVATAVVVALLLIAPPMTATAAQEIAEPAPGIEAPVEHRVDISTSTGIDATASLLPTAGVFADERALILQQTNALRAANNLPPLRLNAALNDIAQDWSVQQASVSTMSHRPSFHLLYPAGWSRAAENVAAGYAASAVVNAWANSPGHRANLLSTNTDIGIGVAANANGRLYFTQNFGRYASAPPTPPGAVNRISGNDRFSTSAQISARTFPSGASTVYIASGFDFPDALSAAALAGAANGPLLLVQPGSIPPVIMSELRRLNPSRIVVAGGSGVVSDSVLASLRTVTTNVQRVSGTTRYATSRNLALDAYRSTGAPVVYLATGTGFADALAAGPAAASVNAPVVLVFGLAPAADAETLALLNTFSTRRVVIVGGEGAVSAGIEQSLVAAGLEVSRFSGADRYSTASLIASHHFPHAARSYLATGTSFADALSGGAAAGALGAPLFTVLSSCVPSSAHSALNSQDPDDLVLLGGLGALSPTVAGFYRC
ncbi:MAG: cell wall-binding repeat-containing protein [Microcella sp.]|uniref:cell wall-binding repeat-containing protein n=1 Tax=Microcella sp. TaxID=1913979 RepID=UPI0024C731E1|nr:cell wall-binding repeat-containing protein [Microcella sp.]UYN83767.1 MAG: cell wall-binding repeat-containing protein [Microcella sp.]